VLYLKQVKRDAPTSIGSVITGLRFFYNHVLPEKDLAPECAFSKKPRKLPTILSPTQIWQIINATENLKHRLILMATYSAGLRAGETIALKAEHVDSSRMLIKVVDGKGRKDRYTLLSKKFLKELRQYYRVSRPEGYLFPSSHTGKALCYETVRAIYDKARRKARIKKGAGLHTLRHYAELGINGTAFTPTTGSSACENLSSVPNTSFNTWAAIRIASPSQISASWPSKTAWSPSRTGIEKQTRSPRSPSQAWSLSASGGFIRRFLLHALPQGFVRIRHFGFLTNRSKRVNLASLRRLFGLSPQTHEAVEQTLQEMILMLTGTGLTICPHCKKGKMQHLREIPRYSGISAKEIIRPPASRRAAA